MKLGIIGLSGSGKTTVFEALTHDFAGLAAKNETRLGTIAVPDTRIGILTDMYRPRKTIYAQVEYLLPGKAEQKRESGPDSALMRAARDVDALIHVVRNYNAFGFAPADPAADFQELDQELILNDLAVVEKRLERVEIDAKKGRPVEAEERDLLARCRKALEEEIPLRRFPEIGESRLLRGYGLLSAKPMMVLFNNADEDESLPEIPGLLESETCRVIRGKLEHELAQMSAEEAAELLEEFNIGAPATDRVIRVSYDILGLISFFTVGEDEVRAWTIRKETPALEAAGEIHSDIKKGFIRAEIISYDDLMTAGSMVAAKKLGTLRLEGKTYIMKDGDIVNFRFNV